MPGQTNQPTDNKPRPKDAQTSSKTSASKQGSAPKQAAPKQVSGFKNLSKGSQASTGSSASSANGGRRTSGAKARKWSRKTSSFKQTVVTTKKIVGRKPTTIEALAKQKQAAKKQQQTERRQQAGPSSAVSSAPKSPQAARPKLKNVTNLPAQQGAAKRALKLPKLVPAAARRKQSSKQQLLQEQPPEVSKTPAPAAPVQNPATPATPVLAKTLSGQQVPLEQYYRSKTPESLLNVNRLIRDGRKPPDHYRQLAAHASSPSQLSYKSISEFYPIPSKGFNSLFDVYRYRGYKKMAKVDEGAFGVVSKAIRMSDSLIVAVKEVDLSRKRQKRVEEMKRELFVLQKIKHPNVVKLIEHFVVDQTLVIIMEFCAGSNLTSYLKETQIDEEEARMLFKQMAIAIKALHRQGIAHRDVKLNNFLLDETRKQVKVADFGLSVVTYRKKFGILYAKTYCGTEPYMAPEILRRNSAGVRCYNPLYADVWSLGVCLFAMLTRTFPFKMNLSQRGLYKAQATRRWRFPKNMRDSLSDELKDLIWRLLDPEANRRITLNGVMAHMWLNPDQTVNYSFDET